MSPQNNAKRAGLTLLTAAVAAVTAGLCCVGPLLYLLFGISAASFAVFTQFEFLRIPLMLVSLGLLLRVFLAALFLQAAVVLWVANAEASAHVLLVRTGIDFASVILPNACCLVL
ncbi:mercuric transport protein MerT, putative [Citrobacter freundii]|uniref:Mercuric transport protein MerT, putative n=1 Tax=Citrobacter freundii TaxID=546 RepID=A0A7G2IPD5_CITFR|nr:mercuric transport protein MerT, putative [Citrobacter freundii]